MAESLLLHLVPPGLEAWAAISLVGISFFTSALTAAVGLGGGITLLAIMANLMPAAAVIPVHGVVQLGSNAGRAAVLWRHTDRPTLLYFALGSVIGIALAAEIVVTLPSWLLRLILGIFIIYNIWAPRLRLHNVKARGLLIGGGLSTFLTMFVGATGPFVGAILSSDKLQHQRLVGTLAACMTVQHCLKVVAFGLLGFAFAAWLPLLIGMLAAGFLGTLAGTQVLKRTPPARFKLAFNLILTALAFKLIFDALDVLLA